MWTTRRGCRPSIRGGTDLLRRLLERFDAQTGCPPVLVNTSFSLGWDPIVCTPRDAYRMFMACGIDMLAMGHYVLRKAGQPATVTAARDGTTDEVFEDKLASPCVAGGTAELIRRGDRLICAETGHASAVTDNIPQLFWPHEQYGDPRDRTEIVKYSGVRNSISVGDRNSWRGAGDARSWPKTSGGSSVWRQGCSAVYWRRRPVRRGTTSLSGKRCACTKPTLPSSSRWGEATDKVRYSTGNRSSFPSDTVHPTSSNGPTELPF